MPETERLDTSAHRAKGLLGQKARRQRPSRTKLKESLTVTSSPSQVRQELTVNMLACLLKTKILSDVRRETSNSIKAHWEKEMVAKQSFILLEEAVHLFRRIITLCV